MPVAMTVEDLERFLRLGDKILRQRQQRFVNRRRADLAPLGFEENEGQRAADEQPVEFGQEIFQYRQFLLGARAGHQTDKRRLRVIEHDLEHRQLAR